MPDEAILTLQFRTVLVVGVLLAGAAAQGSKAEKVRCVLDYEIVAGAETKSLTLTVVLPDTIPGRQKVLDTQFSIPPSRTLIENEVKYAIFELAPVPKKQVIQVSAALELVPPAARTSVPKGANKPAVSDAWLAAETFIERDDPGIQAAGKDLAGKTNEEITRAAAKLVMQNMKYSGFTGEPKGAAAAWKARAGDCTEFADLLVALLRARKIPARHVYGFTTDWVNTAKHSWVEVHLAKRGWVMFDPTFGQASPEALEGPKPIYVWLSTLRNDARLNGRYYYRYEYKGEAAKVAGTYTVTVGDRTKRSPF